MDQAVIEQIVANVLAQLQREPARPVIEAPKTQPVNSEIELSAAVVTADLLAETVRPGQSLRISQRSILTPSARDWLKSKKVVWRRDQQAGAPGKSEAHNVGSWQLIVQTVTPNVRSIQTELKRHAGEWKIELVGQVHEAAAMASRVIGTAECDGVAVVSEFSEIICCRANRSEKVRAAVVSDRKQLELTRQHLGANVICINPVERTFIELRNLLRDFAAAKPKVPGSWDQ